MKLIKLNEIYKQYTYVGGTNEKIRAGCIGILSGRLDDDETGVHAVWQTLNSELRTPDFMTEFDDIINLLRIRKDKNPGLFYTRKHLEHFCRSRQESYQFCKGSVLYGFRVDTENYVYLFKLDPRSNGEHIKCYCYSKELLAKHIAEGKRIYG